MVDDDAAGALDNGVIFVSATEIRECKITIYGNWHLLFVTSVNEMFFEFKMWNRFHSMENGIDYAIGIEHINVFRFNAGRMGDRNDVNFSCITRNHSMNNRFIYIYSSGCG